MARNFAWTMLVVLLASGVGRAEPPAEPPGVMLNQAADAIVGYMRPAKPLGEGATREMLVAALEQLADQYDGTRVSCVFWNVCYQRAAFAGEVWPTYWDVPDPAADTTGWPRRYWLLRERGIDDVFAVVIPRCRRRGISPWVSLRMNDTHYIDDPTKTSPLWQEHPEFRTHERSGFDYARPEVREHYLKLIDEALARWDVDGIELDWMRFAHHFKAEDLDRGRAILTGFMGEVRRRTRAAAERLGHPVRIAARVPATPEFARGLGMDGVAWARGGLVDVLIPCSTWNPSYADIPVERWREEIGPDVKGCRIAAGTDLWIRGAPGGRFMGTSMETLRGFTASMLDRGADDIYLFNHFAPVDFKLWYVTPEGERKYDHTYLDLLSEVGDLETATSKPRRHVLTFHDPVPPGSDYRRPLPAEIGPDRPATFRLHTGPAPAAGRYVVRLGLDESADLAESKSAVRLNGSPCRAIDDLPRPAKSDPRPDQPRLYVGEVAPRVTQFAAPLESVRRGYNAIEVAVGNGGPQRVVWVEAYIEPEQASADE